MKKLSVITVTYNAERTLERTLQSVQKQSYQHMEHLVVDGASKDKTVEILKQQTSNILRWKSEKDNGLYDAMNKAVKMVSGDYLCFLNAGDTFYASDTVEKLMRCIDENKFPDIVYGETAIVDFEGKFLYMRRLKAPQNLTWKSFKNGMLVCHQAFIVKRELFEPYDLHYRFSSDVDWCIRMMKKATSIVHSRQILIRYLNEGLTTKNRRASLIERYKIMVRHYGKMSTWLHHAWFVVRAIVHPEK